MNSVKVTKNAWNKMSEIIKLTKNQYGFLYSASSGGCNGFNFELNLLKEDEYNKIKSNKFYTILSEKNTKLYIDPLSELQLLGTSIDYVTEDFSSGEFESKFKFGINKELMTSCGCGVSFSPKGF
jgi:iron-sulfur cluster assembly accessory protein